MKAALLISGADRRKYGKLKDELANNYLLGTDQYPDTFEKALRILDTIKPQQTTYHTGRSSNEEGEVDVEQYEEGAMTRAEAPGAAQPKTM